MVVESPSEPRMHRESTCDVHWRRKIRAEVVCLLTVKFVALTMLWYLFFGPAHRHAVDSVAAGRQFAIADHQEKRRD